jgi:putative transposase
VPNYKRIYVENHPIFITIATANRNPILIKNIHLLQQSIRKVKQSHPFQMKAYAILPDHCHLLIQLPQKDVNFSQRINLIKGNFSKNFSTPHRSAKGEKNIWQRRFWDHVIRNDLDYSKHLDYIHYNPIKHNYVLNLIDWPHSSFHYYVKMGYYPSNWGKQINENFFELEDAGE